MAVPADAYAAARALVLQHGWNAAAYQILNPGLTLWFPDARDAVVGYARFGRVRVVAGAPACAEARLAAVADEFERAARAAGDRVLFFGAGSRLERTYAERGDHVLVPLGAQPAWDPREWPAIARGKRSLRAQLHRAANKGVTVREWTAADPARAARLRPLLREWLAGRGLPPLGFMTEPDLLDHLEDRRVFVAERGGTPVGYLLAAPVPARMGWLVEQWPRARSAPNGTTHLLVDAALRTFGAEGARYVTLGLAPLSSLGGTGRRQPAWLRLLLRWVRAHGRRFYDFAGLEAFKAGLQPHAWEPVYAIAPGPRFTPSLLRAVAGVFAGGAPEPFVARALWTALRREAATVLSGARPASP